MKQQLILLSLCLCFAYSVQAQWRIESDTRIARHVWKSEELNDNIEMAGRKVAAIVEYTVDSIGDLHLNRDVIFPQLHPYIQENEPDWKIYRAYLRNTYVGKEAEPILYIKGKQFVAGRVDSVLLDGMLHIVHLPSKSGLKLTRHLYPSMQERLFVEEWVLQNTSDAPLKIRAHNSNIEKGSSGEKGDFVQFAKTDLPKYIELAPKEKYRFVIHFGATWQTELGRKNTSEQALKTREAFLEQMATSLNLVTPNAILNTLFEFSKIRASESIFDSELGLIHSPGGGRYYVGIWANDQAEYINPFFPYLGYATGNASAMNAFRAFAKEINEDYKPLRYAFEIEGLVPPFLLDRGDAAMIAYGASQYALASGNKKEAEELWPLIEWCLEYCYRQLNEEGVVQSESDEMEGRIETGKANLSTSSLYYGALWNAIVLAEDLGKDAKKYTKDVKVLRKAIETYFGAEIEGLETYKYYDGHEALRHWICLPLVVGIHDRKEGTVTALFDKLWSENGVYVEKNNPNKAISNIFWDRGTLYALRGTLIAGATEASMEKLLAFSKKRLLGDRVPYVVEAYPEGNMAHLSAESGLYCRVFTEGLFGIYPTGLRSFECTPRLPKDWPSMELNNIKAFGEDFNITVSRTDKQELQILVYDNVNKMELLQTTIDDGETADVWFE